MKVTLYGPAGDVVTLSGVERTVVRSAAYLRERGYTEEPAPEPEPEPMGKKARKRQARRRPEPTSGSGDDEIQDT